MSRTFGNKKKQTGREKFLEEMDKVIPKENGVAEIIFNRPDKMNVLSIKMVQDFKNALQDIRSDDAIGALIITGTGSVAFSAGDDGNDPDWWNGGHNWTPAEFVPNALETLFFGILGELRSLRKPVIAAINGWCIGAGFGIALASDIIIASETARFGMPYVSLGLVTGTSLLPRVVGYHKACQILFTGKPFGAKEAESMGIVNLVVPPDKLEDTAREMAEQIAKQPTQIVGWTKWSLNKTMGSTFKDSLEYEVLACALTYPSKYLPRLVEKRKVGIYSEKNKKKS